MASQRTWHICPTCGANSKATVESVEGKAVRQCQKCPTKYIITRGDKLVIGKRYPSGVNQFSGDKTT